VQKDIRIIPLHTARTLTVRCPLKYHVSLPSSLTDVRPGAATTLKESESEQTNEEMTAHKKKVEKITK
jgi:hypothetical protein